MLGFNWRSLFLVLGVVILLIVSVGCGSTGSNINNDKENIQNSEEQQKLGTEINKLYMNVSTNVTTEKNRIVILRAEPYIQDPSLSWQYSFDIKFEDDKIYINDIFYEESSLVSPVVLYSDGFLAHANYIDETTDSTTANTLTEIKNCQSCYLLQTKQDSKAGQKIYVFKIDNVLFFVRFFDNGEVMRIHSAPIA